MASTISLTVGMDLADISDESAFEADDDDDDRPINLLVNDSFVSTNQWSTLVNEQPVAGLTADNFGARTAVGDVFAFEDKCFSESTTWRSIFVVRVEDGVVIFDEDGEELDEPEHGTPEGQQSLSDFVDDWKDGYYAVGEGVELQPPGGETADEGEDEKADVDGALAQFTSVGSRIKVSMGIPPAWYGGLVFKDEEHNNSRWCSV